MGDKEDLKDGWEKVKRVLHYYGFLDVLKVICVKLISYHHENLLADHLDIKKTWKLIAKKVLLSDTPNQHWVVYEKLQSLLSLQTSKI